MKILFVSPYLPYPIISGGHARVYNLMKQLAVRSHDLYLVANQRYEVTEEQQRELARLCHGLTMVPRGSARSLGNYLRYALSLQPLQAVLNNRAVLADAVDRAIRDWRPDIVHAEHYHVVPRVTAVCRRHGVPVVAGDQSAEFIIMERIARAEANPLMRLVWRHEAWRIRRCETAALNGADRAVMVSRADRDLVLQAGVRGMVDVVDNGADLDYFQPVSGMTDRPTVLFFCTFTFFANVDAALWFHREIWPLVKRAVPGAKWLLAGDQPTPSIRALAGQDVELTGWERDVRKLFARCQVVVVPLRSGSGTKFKVLEAMAAGQAVVTTSIGLEGIDAIPGEDVLLADEPERFAAETVRMLRHEPERREIGRRAREFMVKNLSWGVLTDRLERIYREAIGGCQQP